MQACDPLTKHRIKRLRKSLQALRLSSHHVQSARPSLSSVIWEGEFFSQHSYAHVNRQMCERLLSSKFDLRIRALDRPSASDKCTLSADLYGRIGTFARQWRQTDLRTPSLAAGFFHAFAGPTGDHLNRGNTAAYSQEMGCGSSANRHPKSGYTARRSATVMLIQAFPPSRYMSSP